MNTNLKTILLGACAAIAITACGNKDADAGDKAMSAKPAMLSSISPVDEPFTLKDGTALDVDGFLAGMGMEGALVYDSNSFDEKSGATVLTNVRMAGDQSPFTAGKVELYGVDTDAIAAMAGGQPMTEITDIFRKIRVYDLNGAFPMEGSEGSGTISIAGLDIDSFAIQAGAGQDETDEKKSFAAVANSISLGGISMKGFDMSVADAPEIGDLVLAADDFRIGSYENGKFSGMSLAGMDYELIQSDEVAAQAAQAFGEAGPMIMNSPLRNLIFPKQQSGSIGTMTWDGLSFAGLLGYLEKGEEPPLSASNLLSFGGMQFSDSTQTVNGKLASTMKKVTIAPIEFDHFMPKSIKMVSEGEKYDYTAFVDDDQPEIAEIMTKNGLDNITGNSKFNYAYSAKNKTITLNAGSVAKGLLDSNFSLDIGGIDYPALMSGEAGAEAAAMGITIDGMTLRLDDEKLVDSIFSVVGAATEQDAAQLRQQVVGIISLGALQGGSISPRVPEYATALSTFISEGGALEIKLAPSAPATVGSLAATAQSDPGSILETLNLTVTQSK